MNGMKKLWLMISGFGIAFAILSWLQESQMMVFSEGSQKGFIALMLGLVLYNLIAVKMD